MDSVILKTILAIAGYRKLIKYNVYPQGVPGVIFFSHSYSGFCVNLHTVVHSNIKIPEQIKMPCLEGSGEEMLQLFSRMCGIKLLFQKGRHPIAHQHHHQNCQ